MQWGMIPRFHRAVCTKTDRRHRLAGACSIATVAAESEPKRMAAGRMLGAAPLSTPSHLLGEPAFQPYGETPPYGMIGGIASASFEARSALRSYPTPISGH